MTNLSEISNLLPNQVTVTNSILPNLSAGGPGVGAPSYFDLEITDANGILDGSFDAFCIDTDLPLGFNGFDFDNDGVYGEANVLAPNVSEVFGVDPNTTYNEGNAEAFSASVYSSYDPAVLSDGLGGIIENPENLDLVNWILNNTGTGNALEGFTTGEIQLAIWQLMDDDPPNSEDLTGLEAFFDGFDQANVDEIKDLAQQNGDGFEPHEPGDKVAVILVPDNDGDGVPDGQIIVTAVELSQFPASLGDKVFFDDDRDGIQDAGEDGVEGVTVTLTGGGANGIIGDGDDTTETTTTDADGFYEFTNLNPGEEYKVTFSDLPDGFEFTEANQGSDDGLDSDADPTNGMTQVVTLAPGENNPTLDAGIVQELQNPGIEIEKSTNGVDADTPDLAVEVAAGETVTWTYEVTNTGDVSFDESEVVVTDDQEGTITNIVDKINGDDDNTLEPGETWIYQQTGIAQDLSTVTNTVIDFETDGEGNPLAAGTVIDDEYQNLGVTISATQFGAMIFDSANVTGGDTDLATDTEGNILIISEDGDSSDPDDNAGGGVITFDLDNAVDFNSINLVDIEEAGGEVRTTDTDGNVTTTAIPAPGDGSLQTLNIDDSDVVKIEVDLVGSGAISGLDFDSIADGIYKNIGTVVADGVEDSDPSHYVNGEPDPQPASLGDFVFEDSDGDGIQDADESGVEGVTVTLTGGGADGVIGTGDDDTTATTTTDADGFYEFTNLNPGEEYKVTFEESTLPDGFEFTVQDQGTDDALDSDADPANGMTQVVTLASGENNSTLDAGIVQEPQNPGIKIEKSTNGVDADTPQEAPEIAVGDTVTWTYTVTNTGDVSFDESEVVVTDDQEGTITNIVDKINGDDDNTLEPGETWIYEQTGIAQDLTATSYEDITFNLTGDSYTTGHFGNVRSFTQDGVSVDVSAFSFNEHADWRTAFLGAYSGGLGVTNQNEGGSGHRVDNGGSVDYIVFEFDEAVTPDRALLDYIGHDSDISVWIGDRDGDISLLNDDILNSFTKENQNGGNGGTDYRRWANFNADELTGDTVVIAARHDDHDDSFKLKKLDISVPGETTIGNYVNIGTVTAGSVSDEDQSSYTNPEGEPEPQNPGIDIEKFTNGEDADTVADAAVIEPHHPVTWTYEVTNTGDVPFNKADIEVTDDQEGTITHISDKGNGDDILAPGETWVYEETGIAQDLTTVTPGQSRTFNLIGNSNLDGPNGNIRTFDAGDVSVNASAFSFNAHAGWQTAFLGAYSSGLGVTNQNESTSGHRVDNIGSKDYILFEFEEEVVVDRAFLDAVRHDSDITYWVGTKEDAFNNHNTLNDDFLDSLEFTEDNYTHTAHSRWADINNGEVSGNVLVIAAAISDYSPEDQFKLKKLDVHELDTVETGFYQNLGTVDINGLTDEDLSHYVNPDFSI